MPKIVPDFYGVKEQKAMARFLRLAVVQQQYKAGNLTEQEAKDLLKGRLNPDVEESAVDDSRWLEWEPDHIKDARIAELEEEREIEASLARLGEKL